jgi:hypothetical protein
MFPRVSLTASMPSMSPPMEPRRYPYRHAQLQLHLAAANKKTKREIDFPGFFVQWNSAIVLFDDWKASSNTFGNVCEYNGDTYLYALRALYAVQGYSVSYICNYSKSGNPCNVDEWNQVIGEVGDQCYFSSPNGVQPGK